MTSRPPRPTLRLATQHIDDDCHVPFTQCKSCQSTINCVTSPRSLSRHGMVSRGTTASAARGAVFNTPELLDTILSMLPEQDLLRARRVTVHWNAVIMTSPTLRRKLFLLAEPVGGTWTIEYDKGTGANGNQENVNDLVGEILYLTVPAKLNPLLFTALPANQRGSIIERVQEAELIRLRARPNLARGKESIHYSMLVSQPPCRSLTIRFYYDIGRKAKNKNPRGYLSRDIKNPEGVTWGNILEMAKSAVPSAAISVRARESEVRMCGVVFATEKERYMVHNGLLW